MHWKEERRRTHGREKWAWNDTQRDAYHRRRALKAGATMGAPVRLAEIAERDGWKCGICGEGVDSALRYPDPRSPSQDHIIPLIKGGAHSPENVQLAHLRCNWAKHDG